MQIKCRFLVKKCQKLTINAEKYKKTINTYKQRYYRLKTSSETKISDLELNVAKMKVRQEILESTLKKTYSECKTRKERSILKNLVHNSQNRVIVSKMLGFKCKFQKREGKTSRKCKNPEITNFYVRDDVSRMTSGKKETRTKLKQKNQVRYLLDTLMNTYKKYRSEGGKYGFTTFYTCKPFYVLSPTINTRNTCLCIKHSNIEFQHNVLRRLELLSSTVKYSLTLIACDITNYSCMHNKCQKCINCQIPFNKSNEEIEQKEIEWHQWNRVDHIYLKKDNNLLVNKEVKTKKTAKVKMTGTVHDLKKSYNDSLLLFKKHYFNVVHQQQQYQKAITDLQENEALIVCDFSENYEAKLASEIQSMHFGASKTQITLHTGMVFWKDRTQSFCTVAKNNSHQPAAIWAHLHPIIEMIKEETLNVTVVHFYSDGPSSQYRQKNNFYLLAHFTKVYGFSYTTWSFFESGHGKSVADGIGGCVKRAMDKKVSYGIDIADATDAYEVLKQCMNTVKIFQITDSHIDKILELLPTSLPVLKGTMQLHQVIANKSDNNKLTYRDLSCFCGPHRGLCKCFSPQYHTLVKNVSQNLPSTSFATEYLFLTENKPIVYDIIEEPEPSELSSCPESKIHTESIEFTDYNFMIEDYDTELMEVKLDCQSSADDMIDLENVKVLPLLPVPVKTDKKPTLKDRNSLNCFPERKKCNCSILSKGGKCMVCKNLYCDECVGGPGYFDYICNSCLEDSD